MADPDQIGVMHYQLQHRETASGIGYFACAPPEEMDMAACVARLRDCPNDAFMARHLIGLIGGTGKSDRAEWIASHAGESRRLAALLAEAAVMLKMPDLLKQRYSMEDLRNLAGFSPLICLRYETMPEREAHRAWVRMMGENIQHHRPLVPPKEMKLRPPESALSGARDAGGGAGLAALHETLAGKSGPSRYRLTAPEETIERADRALTEAGVEMGEMQRHEASLSPVGLLRPWQLDRTVRVGRHRFRLFGTQTAYGRGLDLDSARAALMMEIVERCGAFASVDGDILPDHAPSHRLIRARRSDLLADGLDAIHPDTLSTDVPYADELLYWIAGESRKAGASAPVWVPAQSVFVFANLDEVKLYQGLGSTGLASGNTPAEARLSGLLEIIERDHDATTPFDPAACFTVETTDPLLGRLLEHYREGGIRVQFQDLTADLGVPCCKCFVEQRDGTLVKGTGAHLNARRALISALTETPYPFPMGPPSGYGLHGLIRVPVENLPDYTLADPEQDLALLERLLAANGFTPIHVDLTRSDMGIPVSRAILPGMESAGDFSRFSRLHPRLYRNYCRRFNP